MISNHKKAATAYTVTAFFSADWHSKRVPIQSIITQHHQAILILVQFQSSR